MAMAEKGGAGVPAAASAQTRNECVNECVVCMEGIRYRDCPSQARPATRTSPLVRCRVDSAPLCAQLPCCHVTCTACMKKMWPVQKQAFSPNSPAPAGLECPVCRQRFPRHKLVDHPDAPGGVAIAESM